MATANKKSQLFRKNTKFEPQVLEGRDIPSLAKYIKSEACKNIILMLGAGVSTSAGIPDFRSPKTGLYSNLARLKLPYPEAVFDIGFFRKNPVPFYTLAHELYPGKFRPTVTHSFIRLLENKGLLHTCFTQNIDTLERRAGVSDAKIIEAHGSFASQRCIDCKAEFEDEEMKEHVLAKTIAKCKSCGGYIKPDIVFFGESLPPQFIQSISHLEDADLLIVMGTSLTVHPFASLAGFPARSCPRVLVNLEKVGDFGSRPDDATLLGKCDDVVRELCQELGWEQELLELWEKTTYSVEADESTSVEEKEASESHEVEDETAKEKALREDEDELRRLTKEIQAVTEAIEQSLSLNKSAADDEGDEPYKTVEETAEEKAAREEEEEERLLEEEIQAVTGATEWNIALKEMADEVRDELKARTAAPSTTTGKVQIPTQTPSSSATVAINDDKLEK